MEELVRFMIAVAVGAALLGLALGLRAAYRWRLARFRAAPAADLAERYGLPRGVPGVLYLAGQRCVQCVALQEPALERLAAAAEVAVRRVDAEADPDLARRFNILTVPSTVVLGPDHRVRSVNVGYADEATLRQQIA